jgi:hypothetical protein
MFHAEHQPTPCELCHVKKKKAVIAAKTGRRFREKQQCVSRPLEVQTVQRKQFRNPGKAG